MIEQKRKIVPLLYLLAGILLGLLADRYLPIVTWEHAWTDAAGGALVLLGLVIMIWPFLVFSRAGTGIVPFDEATTLITSGMYRVSRNPMYLGMALMLVGIGVGLGSLGMLLPVPLFVWVIQVRFILGEERFLEQAFGQDYLDYKERVRRWL